METIAVHHQKCYNAFLKAASLFALNEGQSGSTLPDLSNEFDRYTLWCGNVGAAHHGLRYRVSLDYRLREAPFYRDRICKFLERLESLVSSYLFLSLSAQDSKCFKGADCIISAGRRCVIPQRLAANIDGSSLFRSSGESDRR